MKITLYTVTECQFSKQEKEYLSSHNLPFEEKNLEINRDFLTEMLTLSNNFAGTPVTKIEKDDGQIVILKGFTLEEFDKTLGFAAQPVNPPPVQSTSQPVQETPSETASQTPVSEPTPTPPAVYNPVQEPAVEEDMPAPVPPPAPTITPDNNPATLPTTPSQPPQQPQAPELSNPMNSVLNNLQDQVSASPPLPNIPDPKL